MTRFASETEFARKTAKQSGARGGIEGDDKSNGFDALMAGLLAPQAPQARQPTPQAPDQTQQEPDALDAAQSIALAPIAGPTEPTEPLAPVLAAPPVESPEITATAGQASSATNDVANAAPSLMTEGIAVTPDDAAPTLFANEPSNTELKTPVTSSTDSEALLTQLAALGVTDAAGTEVTIGEAKAQKSVSSPELSTSATNPNKPAKSGVSAQQGADQLQGESGSATQTSTAPTTPVPTAPTTAPVIVAFGKSKPVDTDAQTSQIASSTDMSATMTDMLGAASPSGETSNLLQNTQAAPLPTPVLTPHTIPMLAATMVRRLESGAKQFSMRLDPPELGQVEVKLSVEPDKKVRAVISADRPEALADLVRSARDLVQALRDAGLDVDEKSLSFNLNDPSNNQQNQANDNQPRTGSTAARAHEAETIVEQGPSDPILNPSDPFQTWRRARIAITV